MGAFAPILMVLLVLPAISVYFRSIGGDNPGDCRYDLLRVDKAQREFILTVLAANDGSLEGLPPDSVIRRIGDELFVLANFEEGKLQAGLSAKSGRSGRGSGPAGYAKVEPVPDQLDATSTKGVEVEEAL